VRKRRAKTIKPRRSRKPEAPPRWYADMGDLLKLKDTTHIGGLLQERGVSVMHGDPGTFKTFVALAVASCVAYGLPLMEGGPRCKRGLALYVAFEDAPGFKARRLAWLSWHKLPAISLDVDAVKVINPYDEAIGEMPGLDFTLTDPKKVDNFIDHAKKLAASGKQAVRLVVIDVLRDAVEGIESTRTFRLAAQHAKKMSLELNCHVMLLHHNALNKDRMRGPQSLEGAIQQRFLVVRSGQNVQIGVMKNREGRTGFTVNAKAHERVMGLVRNRKAITSLAIEFTGLSKEELLEADTEKVLQLCAVFEADTDMSEGQLLKASGMSVTGSGGMQRTLLRKWIPSKDGKPGSILVHNGGTDYRRFFRELVRKRWVYYCQSVHPSEAKTEMSEMAGEAKKPKREPEVERILKKRKSAKPDDKAA